MPTNIEISEILLLLITFLLFYIVKKITVIFVILELAVPSTKNPVLLLPYMTLTQSFDDVEPKSFKITNLQLAGFPSIYVYPLAVIVISSYVFSIVLKCVLLFYLTQYNIAVVRS